MRLITPLVLFVFALPGCAAKAERGKDVAAAEARIGDFFDALEAWDLDALRATVTDDFELVEDTALLTIGDFVGFLTPLHEQGMTGKWELSDFRTEVAGDVAWSRFRNHGVLTLNRQDTNFRWIESVVVLRQPDGTWQIDRYQSTPVSVVGPLAGGADAPAGAAPPK